METSLLLKYLSLKTTEKETKEVRDWLSNDPDGSHTELYEEVHTIFEGLTLYGEKPVSVRKPEKSHFTILKYASIAASLVLFIGISVLLTKRATVERLSLISETINVPAGKTMQMHLEDGTEIWLNSATCMKKPSVFSRHNRTIILEKGELLLDVAKDSKRPFYVKTPKASIKVLGTRFDVSVETDGTSASLLRGSIEVMSEEGATLKMHPFERATITDNGEIFLEKFEDYQSVENWTSGIIDLVGLPFNSLMKKFEKTFDVKIIVERENEPEIRLTRGKVRVIDGIEHALKSLSLDSDFEYAIDYSNNTIIIK